MNLWMIALLVLAAIAGNILMLMALRNAQRREVALQDLAQRKGWAYEKQKATTRTQGYTELSDAKCGWTLRVFTGDRRGGSNVTIWSDRSLGLGSGLAVYAAPLPEKTQTMLNLMMEKAGGLGSVMLDTVFKGLGPEARDLRAIEDDDPATLMATSGAEHAFDALKGAEELFALNEFGSNIADVPFLVRSADGFSLRINKSLKTPEDVEKFVEAGKALAERLRNRGP